MTTELFNQLQTKITTLIKNQLTSGQFIDWEDWLTYDFNPLNQLYLNTYQYLTINEKQQVIFIDFDLKVNNIIADDCNCN